MPRTIFNKRGDKYYGNIYPKITEIAIKDYDTDMILINTLVDPQAPIDQEVQEKTHIRPDMVWGKPTINDIRCVLEKKMKSFVNCKMMAHNGSRFDNSIMLFDKLIDSKKVSFSDTLSIIPIHLPDHVKLHSKNLGKIYYSLFGRNFDAHRAMADVDALIEIMQHLKIKF